LSDNDYVDSSHLQHVLLGLKMKEFVILVGLKMKEFVILASLITKLARHLVNPRPSSQD
jgi:hypothetical protein